LAKIQNQEKLFMTTFRNAPIVVTAVLFSSALLAMAGAGGGATGDVAPTGPTNFLVRADLAAKAPNADGFLLRWLLLEPIQQVNGVTQNAVLAAAHKEYFPNQFTVIPHDGDKVSVNGTELTWHALDTKFYNFDLYYFGSGVNMSTGNVLMWGVTIVNCPEEMHDVRLAIGSNDASVWWVNGQEVISIFGDRLDRVDDGVSKRLTLKKGANIIRCAIHNQGGMTDFCARFLDANYKPITNITVNLNSTAN
jgi:hypothetical protein